MREFSQYISDLPTNHVEALHQICTDFFEIHGENESKRGSTYPSFKRHEYQMFFRIASQFVSMFELGFDVPNSFKRQQKYSGNFQ